MDELCRHRNLIGRCDDCNREHAERRKRERQGLIVPLRKLMPDALDVEEQTASGAFYLQECRRYREALIQIEARIPEGIDLTLYPENIWKIATDALDEGDEAAGE